MKNTDFTDFTGKLWCAADKQCHKQSKKTPELATAEAHTLCSSLLREKAYIL